MPEHLTVQEFHRIRDADQREIYGRLTGIEKGLGDLGGAVGEIKGYLKGQRNGHVDGARESGPQDPVGWLWPTVKIAGKVGMLVGAFVAGSVGGCEGAKAVLLHQAKAQAPAPGGGTP